MSTSSVSPRQLLSVKETAARLSVSEKTIRRRIADGELPAVQIGRRRHALRIPVAELERWLYGRPEAR